MIELIAHTLNIKLAEPITISFHTWRYIENILVTLRYQGLEGYGEAAPFKPITGDSQAEVIGILKGLPALDLDPEKDSPERLHGLLDTRVPSQTLKAAIDFAYHDLLGKRKGIPSYQLYANTPACVPNTITLFIKDSPAEVREAAATIYRKYPHLKILKIKLKGRDDFERIQAIQSASPTGMAFTLDANQAFADPREAAHTINRIVGTLRNVILVEEPCPKGDLDKLAYVKENVRDTMVFADESAATIDDAKRVIAAQAAHGINIKLQKAGGIWPGRLIASLCKKANLKVMVGSMLEGPLANMAGVHFAVSTPNVTLSDLDMDLDMPAHVQGMASFQNGVRAPNEKPGFGIIYNQRQMQALMREGELIYERIV